jgi:hypothetical protein
MAQVVRQADGIDRRVADLAGRAVGMDVLHAG